MSTAIDFDLGSLTTDATLDTAPTLPTFTADATTGHVATVELEWSKATDDYAQLFSFKTDSADLADDIDNTDITFGTDKTKWYSGDFLSTDYDAITYESGATTLNTGESANLNIAGEFVRHVAQQIFGGQQAADVFNNEATLLSDTKALYTTLNSAIDTKLDTSNTQGASGTRSNTNFAWQVFSKMLGDQQARVLTVINGRSSASDTMYVPLAVGDSISFSVTLKFSANADGNGASNSNHGIGSNAVADRKYKIKLNLVA